MCESGGFTFLLYMDNVIYILLFSPSVLIIEKLGMKIALLLAAALSVGGAWLALAVEGSEAVRIIGQLVVDCGFPLVASSVTKMPAQWFPFRERYYSFGVLAGLLGYAIGDSSGEIFGVTNPTAFAIFLSVVGGVSIALLLVFYTDKPLDPPSYSEATKDNSPFNLRQSISDFFSREGLLVVTIASALFVTFIVDISKGLGNIITIGDGLDQDVEGITVFFYVPGILSVMLPALYLGRGVTEYKTVFSIITIASFVTLGLLVVAIAYAHESQYFLYTMAIICGFVTNMGMPLCYEIVTETGHPLSEALTAGAVHAMYGLLRIMLKVLNKLLDSTSSGIESTAYCFVLIVLVFLSFVLMFFAKVKYRRLKPELKHEANQL